jgi:hypothetical protein
MKLRPLLSVYAVLMVVGGLVALILPAPALGLYGVTTPVQSRCICTGSSVRPESVWA